MDKVEEKVVWNKIPDSTEPKKPQDSHNSTEIECFKCKKSIPQGSVFCPCCQTRLIVSCPKCGHTYSAKFSNCNQCGTNREKYLIEEELKRQREEQERAERRKREYEKQCEEEKEIARVIKLTILYSIPLSLLGCIGIGFDYPYEYLFWWLLTLPLSFLLAWLTSEHINTRNKKK